MRAVTPPEEVAAEHANLVSAMAEMQEKVAAYLRKAGLEGEFSFDSLNADPEVQPAVERFFMRCEELRTALYDHGAKNLPDACAEA